MSSLTFYTINRVNTNTTMEERKKSEVALDTCVYVSLWFRDCPNHGPVRRGHPGSHWCWSPCCWWCRCGWKTFDRCSCHPLLYKGDEIQIHIMGSKCIHISYFRQHENCIRTGSYIIWPWPVRFPQCSPSAIAFWVTTHSVRPERLQERRQQQCNRLLHRPLLFHKSPT